MNLDIFISYKNDNAGNNFAIRLKENLEKRGYGVFLSSEQMGHASFPEKLRSAIQDCKDFILIVSQGCLEQLIAHEKTDWIREEVLEAQRCSKRIIPVMMSGVTFPKDPDDMPGDLKFLSLIDNVIFPEQYECAPFEELLEIFMTSKPEKDDIFRDTYNSNKAYDVKKEFETVLENAKKGSEEAMYVVSFMYYYGFFDGKNTSDRNFDEAYGWLKRISEKKGKYKAYADSMIGRMYYDGTVPAQEQSYEIALEYHKKAAKDNPQGYSASRVAYMQQESRGCEFDFDKVEEAYLALIQTGDISALRQLAEFYLTYGEFQKAAHLLESIDNLPAVGEFELGMLYKRGVMTNPPKPDYIMASYHFQNAIHSEYPYPEAAYQLGLMYFAPTGKFKKDFKMAEEYFLLAARLNSADAQYMLGYMYEFGFVEKNAEKAISYFLKAANNGNINAFHHLAMLYQQDPCRNYHKAFRYASSSAANGIAEGEFILANLLYIGRGCEADTNKAYKYYKRALAHGMEQASFMIERIEQDL